MKEWSRRRFGQRPPDTLGHADRADREQVPRRMVAHHGRVLQALDQVPPNACRVVAVVDEADRYGYACGTLPGHAGTGEERFVVERDRADDAVWYEVASFSRPRHALVRLGAAYLRVVQRRFGRESAAALRRAVEADETGGVSDQ